VRGARRALLLAVIPFLLAPPAVAAPERAVLVYVLDGVGYEEALAHPTLRSIHVKGGIGLMTETEPIEEVLADIRALKRFGVAVQRTNPNQLFRHLFRETLGPHVEPPSVELLVLGFTDGHQPAPILLGRGTAEELARNRGPARGLTSETTGRPGVVSNVDLLPTILEFLGQPIPEDAAGNPIRAEGSPPTALHRTYLEYRKVVTPVGLIVLGLALAALAVGLALILGPWRPPVTMVRGVAVVGLFAVSLQVGMLAGSWLPDFSWPVVLGTVAGVGALVTALALWAGRRSPYVAVAVVGAAGVALVVMDWLLGWRSLLTPLLGGSALEGVRFYGLGNSYAGLLLAGVVLVAALLRPWAGVAVLVAAALFAGVPWAGADLGGGITLFGAAGIWWALRVRSRVGLAELAGVVAAVLGGAVLLVLLHRLAPEPSHVTRAVEEAGDLGGIAGASLDRLALNLQATARTPLVWLALAAVPAAIWVAWRRPRPFRPALETHSGWREAVLALGLSAVLGYLLNDTYGLTAVALVYLSLALVHPALDRKNVRSKRKKVVNKQAPRVDSRTRFG
jgi:hypothetical protein